MKRIIIYIFALMGFCSCGIYREFKTPVQTVESDIALPGWKEIFTDPLLQDLIDTALVRNTDLEISLQRIEQSRAALTNARLSFLPSIKANTDGLEAFWSIDLFGNLLNSSRAARASWEGSIQYSKAVRSNLIATVAASYYTLVMLDRQVGITKEACENWTDTEKTLQALKNNNSSVTEAAVLQARAQRLALESELLSLEQKQAEAQNSICSLLLKEPQQIKRSGDGSVELPQTNSVPLNLIAGRPDVQLAIQEYAKAYYLTNKSRSQFLPSISLNGTMDWQAVAQLVASATQAIFRNWDLASNVKIAKAEQDIARKNFEQTLLDASIGLNNAITAIKVSEQKYAKDNEQVAVLEEAVRKTELLMQHSSSNFLEVLEARKSLLSAQQSLATDLYTRECALISLYSAMGGGAD